jgi:malonyl-CoA/methylmalonyl-CoA synthetase
MRLLEALRTRDESLALRFPDHDLSYARTRGAAARVALELGDAETAATMATPTAETAVALLGALAAGKPLVPINPKAGVREVAHIVSDSDPDVVLCVAGGSLPDALADRRRIEVDLEATAELPANEPAPDTPAVIVYTSGTTGSPKGAILPRRSLGSNLEALARAWDWTADDTVVHGLPLFHVHGLVLGTLGPIVLGGASWNVGRFSASAVSEALRDRGTMLFGVPTMYHRLAEEAEHDAELAESLRTARLLVSGSAALPAVEHDRIERLTGQRIVERYGMTETLMNTSVRATGERRAGYVGLPLDGVDVRLVDDAGTPLDAQDDETLGEIEVRGPNLFVGYLNLPDTTAEAFHDGWFRTGDLATRASDGYLRIVGRRATDLIKSGGFKIGAGEIEGALLEHPAVAEAAVTAQPDVDLGESVVAWIVLRDAAQASPEELADHVAHLLSPHKRPRVVHFVDELPRNALGKLQKRALVERLESS